MEYYLKQVAPSTLCGMKFLNGSNFIVIIQIQAPESHMLLLV